MSGKKSRSMIPSMAETYASSSSTAGRFREFGGAVDEEALGGLGDSSGAEDGDGDERWRGEWPGERSIVAGARDRSFFGGLISKLVLRIFGRGLLVSLGDFGGGIEGIERSN